MPRGCGLYISLLCPIAIGVSLRQWQTWGCGGRCYIASAWGFGVARFDLQGNSYEPQDVERATVQGFTSFLCLYETSLIHKSQTVSESLTVGRKY